MEALIGSIPNFVVVADVVMRYLPGLLGSAQDVVKTHPIRVVGGALFFCSCYYGLRLKADQDDIDEKEERIRIPWRSILTAVHVVLAGSVLVTIVSAGLQRQGHEYELKKVKEEASAAQKDIIANVATVLEGASADIAKARKHAAEEIAKAQDLAAAAIATAQERAAVGIAKAQERAAADIVKVSTTLETFFNTFLRDKLGGTVSSVKVINDSERPVHVSSSHPWYGYFTGSADIPAGLSLIMDAGSQSFLLGTGVYLCVKNPENGEKTCMLAKHGDVVTISQLLKKE